MKKSKITMKDLASIPDALILSEAGKRRAKKRRSYTGGVVWAKHNPTTTRCRCADCIQKRKAAAA